MQSIFANIPNWIEALSYLTLIVLKGYAADTKTIAMASASQTENAQKPFVALVTKNAVPARHFVGGWAIENQGFGSALDIRHSEPQGNEAWVYTTPLSKGDF